MNVYHPGRLAYQQLGLRRCPQFLSNRELVSAEAAAWEHLEMLNERIIVIAIQGDDEDYCNESDALASYEDGYSELRAVMSKRGLEWDYATRSWYKLNPKTGHHDNIS